MMSEKRCFDGRIIQTELTPEQKYENMLDNIRKTLSDEFWDIPIKIEIESPDRKYELDDVYSKLFCDKKGNQQVVLTLKVK